MEEEMTIAIIPYHIMYIYMWHCQQKGTDVAHSVQMAR